MKILVTGASGFLGKNLCSVLLSRGHSVLPYDVDTPNMSLQPSVYNSDFIVHLAGVNRPINKDEFFSGNSDFTLDLIQEIKSSRKTIPIIFSSSIQAAQENDYGKSKRIAEDYLFSFQKETGNLVYIFRLTNVFGKWSRPNYNSVVATFCHNISRGLPIQINNPELEISLLYVDDVIKDFVDVIEGKKVLDSTKLQTSGPQYLITLNDLAAKLYGFKESRTNLLIPNVGDAFEKKLFSTYLSFLNKEDFSYPLKTNCDERGYFSEVIKTSNSGQISINLIKPGVVKGNHFHHTKIEKFLVVRGSAKVNFRKVGTNDVISYETSEQNLAVIDIPPGYTHNIENIGKDDVVIVIWASENFDKGNPDTYFLEVNEE